VWGVMCDDDDRRCAATVTDSHTAHVSGGKCTAYG
jgi:hypothetical protein